MEDRIKDKIKDIKRYLEELEGIIPDNLKQYKNNLEKKAACERYFEKIVEAVIDLAYLIIRKNKFKIPESEGQAFEILENKKLISKELSKNLQDCQIYEKFYHP